jgi:hypothetical protein
VQAITLKKMSTKNSNLLAKKSPDELKAAEKLPSKFTIRFRDVMILAASFVFTIVVACCVLLHVDNNQRQNAMEIEKIVEKILATKMIKTDFERKREYLDESEDEESLRSKRAAHDIRIPRTGKIYEKYLIELITIKIR